jgi:hypothetical protein
MISEHSRARTLVIKASEPRLTHLNGCSSTDTSKDQNEDSAVSRRRGSDSPKHRENPTRERRAWVGGGECSGESMLNELFHSCSIPGVLAIGEPNAPFNGLKLHGFLHRILTLSPMSSWLILFMQLKHSQADMRPLVAHFALKSIILSPKSRVWR